MTDGICLSSGSVSRSQLYIDAFFTPIILATSLCNSCKSSRFVLIWSPKVFLSLGYFDERGLWAFRTILQKGNAGMAIHAGYAETTEAQFDELMNVHLKGVYFLAQTMLPLISDGGRILNVSSGLARFALPGYSAYTNERRRALRAGVWVYAPAPQGWKD
jgi:hypothetical protein